MSHARHLHRGQKREKAFCNNDLQHFLEKGAMQTQPTGEIEGAERVRTSDDSWPAVVQATVRGSMSSYRAHFPPPPRVESFRQALRQPAVSASMYGLTGL